MRFWTAVRDFKRLADINERPVTPRDGELVAPTPRSEVPVNEADKTAMQDAADAIITKHLMPGAEAPVTLSAAHQKLFKKAPAPGVYEYSLAMFDKVEKAVYKDIKTDGFARFKLTDAAEALVRKNPVLAVEDPTESFGGESAQAQLKELAQAALELAKCDRMTFWLYNGRYLYSVGSTNLGNAIIKLPRGVGFAGKAAKSGEDVIVEDAWSDPAFNKSMDEKTGYKTKSVLCVVIRRGDAVAAVVQMLNKKGAAENEVAFFTEEDARLIRKEVGPPLLACFDDVALNTGEETETGS